MNQAEVATRPCSMHPKYNGVDCPKCTAAMKHDEERRRPKVVRILKPWEEGRL